MSDIQGSLFGFCKVGGCRNIAVANRLCAKHTCKVCGAQARGRGLCEKHYRRALRRGEFRAEYEELDKQILLFIGEFPRASANSISIGLQKDSKRIRERLVVLFQKGLIEKHGFQTKRQPYLWSIKDEAYKRDSSGRSKK